MRRIMLWFAAICGVLLIMAACSDNEKLPKTSSKIYFVDAQLNRLVVYERDITGDNAEKMAKSAVEVLKTGEDGNKNIRRLIPKDDRCIAVKVRDSIAYINVSSNVKNDLSISRDIEKLFIYQLVNTLTEIKGIRFVKFTIDGKNQKDFMGFYDMREVYKYKYPE